MKTDKSTILTIAQKCKNILASNWKGYLNTVKADAKGSKGGVYTSKVKYIVKRGKPYIWIPEKDMHNVNTIIDERGSLAVASPFPGPLATLFRSMNKLPARVALTGDVVPLREEKAKLAAETLRELVLSEHQQSSESAYSVSAVLRSSKLSASRSENLQELLTEGEKYRVYIFNIRKCMFLDGHGRNLEVDLGSIEKCEADPIASLSARLIDGINQNEARRRALILFCLTYLNANARDAYMLSVDLHGFDVLAKVPGPVKDGHGAYQWEELRFKFKKEASDVESFCRLLVEMEEEAVKNISSYSGLNPV